MHDPERGPPHRTATSYWAALKKADVVFANSIKFNTCQSRGMSVAGAVAQAVGSCMKRGACFVSTSPMAWSGTDRDGNSRRLEEMKELSWVFPELCFSWPTTTTRGYVYRIAD